MDIKIQRVDIIDKISDMLAGNAKRDDVFEWAFNIFDNDSLRLEDPVILKYLKLLGAVDLPSSDWGFLYTDDDLRRWINEIENE
ncbi:MULTISPECIES: hypothetical protein [unclassified Pantoea]|uniref:hypothetical protein n=1 Tax=unclassified Pantoea TaxID=2630326 RepID=UPI0024773FA1|nr:MULTISPECIES: hypothetical protein [unclassified Pantoea]GME48154.1 hypothetical protein ACJ3_44870 [Pantoea sp. QMID3]GME48309.1 hypothetical protein ACJ1_44640 [Pantoea sp. QMID1]GME62944.1 hypothetical protein ACJ4_44740 [Pantoea sp. QMID4]GME64048.1 hypothetical protein ACJ2_44870 [Pantoea sp. QMID2]